VNGNSVVVLNDDTRLTELKLRTPDGGTPELASVTVLAAEDCAAPPPTTVWNDIVIVAARSYWIVIALTLPPLTVADRLTAPMPLTSTQPASSRLAV
jgi:hypothetical protein